MALHFSYNVTLKKESAGGYVVTFPDLPEAITQGENIEDALREASDCLEEAIANRIAMKLPIPVPKQLGRRKYQVALHDIMNF